MEGRESWRWMRWGVEMDGMERKVEREWVLEWRWMGWGVEMDGVGSGDGWNGEESGEGMGAGVVEWRVGNKEGMMEWRGRRE
ncbi:hypothetical protein Pmani_008682 [Petrolisthes manimaculis]|uniref:Uncharacterized protein n=1 Tax=Petrolisthes manimaculis TaxID=1843537 RepID=A0AAE1UEE4_9EUCA|nr:hypothetical protein Pmani_008682 [Petrolisthes manimaculis]